MSKPSSLHIASIAVFSLNTCPLIVLIKTFATGIFDDHLHEQPAETASLPIGPDQDGVFATVVVCIRMEANDADHLAGVSFHCDKCHRRAHNQSG